MSGAFATVRVGTARLIIRHVTRETAAARLPTLHVRRPERAVEVGIEIVRVFQADRQPQQVGRAG
jgi:DNA-binding TFAR19-related protein (PDSD5 family)